MQGRKSFAPKMIYQVNLDTLVPSDHFYRKLDAALDLHFLYKETAAYYGSEGQESIDPIVFFKIILVGYLNNINSDRQLIRYCSDCLSVRWFIRYDIDEELPWFSTISRTRQLYGEEVFLHLFKKILALCVDKGMVRGKRQAIDSAFIKANASMDSLIEKEIVADAEAYAQELSENSEEKANIVLDKARKTITPEKKKSVEQHHRWKKREYKNQPGGGNSKQVNEDGELIRPKFLSNHTHASSTDPDARISVKPGKARQLNYFGQIAVDDAHHVITAAGADFADKRDSQCLENILNQCIGNLKENDIVLEQITTDTGYSSGEVLQYLADQNIDAYIPNFGQYVHERPGFIFNPVLNQYECQRGFRAILAFKGIKKDNDGHQRNIYRSSETVCKNCPLREPCCGKSSKFKKIDDSIHKSLYAAMHDKMHTAYARKIIRIRSKTVEPVLGTLINFLNMKRVNTRGIKQANKHVLMAALCYNLKKLLNFKRPGIKINYQTIEIQLKKAIKNAFLLILRIMISPRSGQVQTAI